jgi:hypothetical protein
MNEADKRSQKVKSSIEFILARRGTVYTLGLLMGILCRLSRVDYNIVQELEYRAENLDKH